MKWWRSIVAQELRKILAYRSDFWVTFLGQTFIQLTISRALWQSIFESEGVSSMKGYTLELMTMYYLIAPIATRMIGGQNIGFIANEIYEGTFSRYLIYPLSAFQYKALTYLTNSAFFGLQLLLIFGIYRILLVNLPFTLIDFTNLLAGILILFFASFTYCMMVMCIELIALWADNIWSLVVMLRFATNFLGGSILPLIFFPEWALNILKFTPFPYLISLPIKTIMGNTNFEEICLGIIVLLGWACFFMELVKLIWRRGEKVYTGVGI